MSTKEKPQIREIVVKNVRLSFPNLFEAKAVEGSDKKRFGASLLIPKGEKANTAAIKAEIDHLIATKFEGKKAGVLLPFNDGDEKEWDGYPGHMYLSANRAESQKRPVVIDRDRSPLQAEDGRPYAGCYVNAAVRFFTINGKGDAPRKGQGKRICCSLEAVQFSRDGETFGAPKTDVNKAFEDLSDEDDDGLGGDAAEDDGLN